MKNEAQDFAELRALFEEAAGLSEEGRSDFLDDVERRMPGRAQELRAMLAVADEPDFMEPVLGLGETPAGDDPEPLAPSTISSRSGVAQVGDYHLGRLLGSGGMGVVHEATRERPHRRVAIKLLRADRASETLTQRFQREIEMLARLDHPAIARVFENGVHREDDGATQPWFAMEFVDGARDIIHYARERELDLDARLGLFLELCEAIHHGHQRGVIHRDLKAANVLVDEEGRLKVIDFGIARSFDGEEPWHTRLTWAGEIVGTLPSMAPEQLADEPAPADTRTDVHALGLLLYELVAGRPPFDWTGRSLTDVARIVREEEPPNPCAFGPRLPQDLGWVVLKALEKEPDRRYASVSELAADVRRVLTHEPVEAGPPSRTYRLRKFVRRYRVAVAVVGVILLALTAGIAVAWHGLAQARLENTKFRSINSVLTEILSALRVEQGGGQDVPASQLLDRAAELLGQRLADLPEAEAPLRLLLAEGYRSVGLSAPSEVQAERALELLAADPAAALADRWRAAWLLGTARLDQGDLQGTAAVLANYSPKPEADPTAHLRLEGLAAQLLVEEGWASRGADRFSELVEQARAIDNLPLLHGLLADLVQALRHADRPAEAVPFANELMDAYGESYGDEDHRTLQARRVFASLVSIENPLEAKGLLEELIPAYEALHGPRHPDTLVLVGELGWSLYATGRAAESIPLYERVFSAWSELHGETHQLTLVARANLARAREAVEPGSGLADFEELVLLQAEQHGADHPDSLLAMLAYARVLWLNMRLGEAEGILLELLSLAEERPEESARIAVDATAFLGTVYTEMNRDEDALVCLEEAHAGYLEHIGPDGGNTLRTASLLASFLLTLAREEEAVAITVESLANHTRPAPSHDREVLETTAELFGPRTDVEGVLSLFAEAARVARWIEPADDPVRLQILSLYGIAALQAGEEEQAESLLQELGGLRSARANTGPDRRPGWGELLELLRPGEDPATWSPSR